MSGIKRIVRAFLALWEAAQTSKLPQGIKRVRAPGQNLVDIGLMPDIPNDFVPRTVKNLMQSYRQLHDTEVGSKMSTGFGNMLD